MYIQKQHPNIRFDKMMVVVTESFRLPLITFRHLTLKAYKLAYPSCGLLDDPLLLTLGKAILDPLSVLLCHAAAQVSN